MKWIARTFVFIAALAFGTYSAALHNLFSASGLSDCVVDLGPENFSAAQPPKGVRVMYAGWLPGSDERSASIRLVVHNGLDVPVYYRSFTPTDAVPEVRIDGKKFEQWTCLNGIEEFQIAPGTSAEVHAAREYFPRHITKNATATVGLYLNLSPERDEAKKSHILVITEPFAVPYEVRTARVL